MERSLLKEVSVKTLQARLNSNKVKPMLFPNFFGLQKVDSLKWETLIGEKGVPVMADVISFDSSAPEKTRQVIGKMAGDIPKMAIKRSMNESDWNFYNRLRTEAKGEADKLALIDLVFKDTDFVYNGVRARMEHLALQALSTGALSLDKNNNAGLVTETSVSFGVPDANKVGTSVSWATIATSKPIDDIEAQVLAAEAQGISIQYVVMRNAQFIQLRNSTDTQNKLKGWLNNTGKIVSTLALINEFMAANMLPKIVVVNPSVTFESEDHARTIINPWAENRVVLLPELSVGNIQHGPIAEENSSEISKIATLVKQDFALVSKWATLDPFKEWTKAEANAFPVLNDPTTLFYIRTDNATWA
jgi:hypothetical protein